MRIATASVRTGFAMTGIFARGAVQGRAGDRKGRPYGGETRGVVGRDDVGIVPYESVTRNSANGPSGTPAPTDALLMVRRGGALPRLRATARVAPTDNK